MDAVHEAHKSITAVLTYDSNAMPDRAVAALERAEDQLAKHLAATEAQSSLDNLVDRARGAAARLASAHLAVLNVRARFRSAQEAAELAEAKLTLSDGYAAGKNAEVRQAWLRVQRTQDAELAAALATLDAARRELERAEAAEQEAANEYRLAIEEVRLERAYLLARSEEN